MFRGFEFVLFMQWFYNMIVSTTVHALVDIVIRKEIDHEPMDGLDTWFVN